MCPPLLLPSHTMAEEAGPVTKRLKTESSEPQSSDRPKSEPQSFEQADNLGRKISASDVPNEIRLNIASHLNSLALKNLALVNKSFYACMEPLLWSAVSFNITNLPDCQRKPVCRQVELPTSISADTVKRIKRIKIYVDGDPHWRKATWGLQTILKACPKLEHLELALPLPFLSLQLGELQCRSLRVSNNYFQSDKKWSSLSRRTLQNAICGPYLHSLELESCEKIDIATDSFGLSSQPLTIKNLTIKSCNVKCHTGIFYLIRACRSLESVRIEYRLSNSKDAYSASLHHRCGRTLRHAFHSQSRSLSMFSITPQMNCSDTATYMGTDIGNYLRGMALNRWHALTRVSVPLSDPYGIRMLMDLPSTLQILQIQLNTNACCNARFNDIECWVKARLDILDIIESLASWKRNRFRNLQQLIWWYNVIHIKESPAARRLTQKIVESQRSRLADRGVKLIWSEADIFEETPFSTFTPSPPWRDGGLCTAENVDIQAKGSKNNNKRKKRW